MSTKSKEDPRLKDFTLCRQALEDLGAQYNVASKWETNADGKRVEVTLEKFQNVKIPLTPEEWVSLVSKDGANYIGGCCGNSSGTQDLVCSMFRFESGWVGRNLVRIAEEVIDHDGDESLFATFHNLFSTIEKAKEKPPGPRDPWAIMAAVWHLMKYHMSDFEVPHSLADHIPPIRKALYILETISRAITWEHLFQTPDSMKGPESQRRSVRAVSLARFLPALEFVRERVNQLDFGEVIGEALIDLECGPNAIAKNGYGFCIYETKTDIDELLSEWENDVHQKDLRKRFTTRPVRVNRREGIVFTDTNEVYDFEHKTPSKD